MRGDYKTVLITGKRDFGVHIWVTIKQGLDVFLSTGNAEHDLILRVDKTFTKK